VSKPSPNSHRPARRPRPSARWPWSRPSHCTAWRFGKARSGIVGQLAGLVRALPWRDGGRFLRQRHRRRRASPWERRARFANAFRMSPTLRTPDATAFSAHRRAADQNAILCAAQQKRFGEPPRRGRNGRLHHRHTGKVIMSNSSVATEGGEPPRALPTAPGISI